MPLMVDRRLIYHFDVLTLFLMVTIVGLGVLTVYSATYSPELTGPHPYAVRQAAWGAIGLTGALVMAIIDYRRFEMYAPLLYMLGIGLLAAVPFVGTMGNGSRRWIDLGPAALQPSELMKPALIVMLARHFHRNPQPGGLRLRDLVVPLVYTMIPFLLILSQPDLGTAGLLALIATSMTLMAGPSGRTLAILGGAALACVPMFPILIGQLKPYQQRRIQTFLNPELDPLGAGYHVIQSKIAIGSGGISGKGFLMGTQNQLNFLPEQHTDFIFSVFSEEWGFVGAMTLIGLYVIMMLRGLVVVGRAKDRFGALLAFGVLANIFWQAAINLGMTTGVMPVVGITLPFFSYGGSSLLTLMGATGLIINVNMRRHRDDRLGGLRI